MGFSGREASWTAVVLYRFSLEGAEAEDKDSRAAHPVRAAKAPEVWRSPRPGGLPTSARRRAADGGSSAVLRRTANRPGSQRVASPNTLGFFRPLQQGHVLRTGTVRGPPTDREPSRFAAGTQPNRSGFSRPLLQGHMLRTGTVRGPQRAELEFGAPRRGFSQFLELNSRF